MSGAPGTPCPIQLVTQLQQKTALPPSVAMAHFLLNLPRAAPTSNVQLPTTMSLQEPKTKRLPRPTPKPLRQLKGSVAQRSHRTLQQPPRRPDGQTHQ